MHQSSHEEILNAVLTFLTSPDASEVTAPEYRELNRVFALAFRDSGYEFHSVVTSLTVTELAGETATVQAMRTLVPKRRKWAKEQSQELTVQLVKHEGWKVRDLILDGRPVLARMHPVLVEPAEAEGISVRAWARTEPDGRLCIAIKVHNESAHRWRLRCAGGTWEKGRMWFLSQALWKLILRGSKVSYTPGAERGILLTVPAKVERLWLQASRPGSLRSPLFALSWEPARRAASAEAARGSSPTAVRAALYLLPVAALAAPIAIFKSTSAALIATSVLLAITLVETHWCVYRFERKLARFRAESSG